MTEVRSTGASPYSTGGGGTVLEHRYGAVLLADLLIGDPVPGLGDDVEPIEIRFQATVDSPVDDLVVVGLAPDGAKRRLSVGVRRDPSLSRSDDPSARLLASYLRVVADDWDAVQAGRWRLALAVISPNPAVQQLGRLAEIARATPGEAAFRGEVQRPRRTNASVRRRLEHLDALVESASTMAGINLHALSAGELTWRLLTALRVHELRLEGVDETDRTHAVSRLRTVAGDGSTAAAEDLFGRLEALASRYAPAAAQVSQRLLRRDLSGTWVGRSPARSRAWELLDGLASRLHDRTGFRLSDQRIELEIARATTREALAEDMTAVAEDSGTLVIFGEPDVGKSALSLRAAGQLAEAGVAVTSLNLRDLPPTTFELEQGLGGRLVEILASTAVGSGRLLVVDGAESVLEGRASLMTDVATGALRAGLGVAAVSRSDGGTAVADALRKAGQAAGRTQPIREHEVPRLAPAEVKKVTEAFTGLARVAADPRSAWLLGRPGLVDLLLRAGAALDLPGGPLSEADIFAVVWARLVRKGEAVTTGDPAPDARERALVLLARRLLLPGSPSEPAEVTALASLRADGLMLAAGPTAAWNAGDQFASDLIRDLSVARLLVTEGFDLLTLASDPRWALRAVRLACQARMLTASKTRETWNELRSTFDALATQHGQRWAEIPAEATLTLGSSSEILKAIWPDLASERRARLHTVLRLALQRHTSHEIGDPTVLGPLVALTFCGDADLGQDDRYVRVGTGSMIRELVLAWLRGLVMTGAGPDPLRQRVRDRILQAGPLRGDEFAVEALAMLGPDLDPPAETLLRDMAETRDGYLVSAVECVGPIVAMSEHQPELLITLTEAYYIERREDEHGYAWRLDGPDFGIRHHHKVPIGFGAPGAAHYFGPFFRLLNSRPVETLGLINRMLDHAAAIRVGRPTGPISGEDPSLQGLDLELPGVGSRRCVGDEHVWSWYRGSSVGPYPCMSALLAVERFADHLVETLNLPMPVVVAHLLRDCHNLAVPGLVVGLLIRHPDHVGELLDRWLVHPEVWYLEFSRRAAEGGLHVQGADPPELVGRERRRLDLRDVAGEMTVRTMLAGDQRRLAALAAVADELVQRTRDLVADAEDASEQLASVEGWAAALRPESFHATETEDGRLIIQQVPPQEVAERLAASRQALLRGQEAMRLQNKYALADDRVAPTDTLLDDIALAREFAEDPPDGATLHPEDPIAAVAAAAVVGQATHNLAVPDDDLRWAAGVLVEFATQPWVDGLSHSTTIFPMGADRSAAASLPLLLLPEFDDLALDRRSIGDAMRHCSTSLFEEVRVSFARAVPAVWAAPCNAYQAGETCRHELAWVAVQDGLRDCRLGGWDQSAQQRLPDPLDGPYPQALLAVDTKRIMVNRLTGPIIATATAADSDSCVSEAARQLLGPLLDAHRRGSDHWATQGYGRPYNRHRGHVARVLIQRFVLGHPDELTAHLRHLAVNARGLQELLRDLGLQFTYEEALRPTLPEVWPTVMATVLDAIGEGADLLSDYRSADDALAELLPTPQLDMADTDMDATLNAARSDWLHPDVIAELVEERWLPIARGRASTLDALVQLARCAQPHWQATTGLMWAEQLINEDCSVFASRSWHIIDWLEVVRASGHLDQEATARWRRIVDGLAASGDGRAVGLQRLEE